MAMVEIIRAWKDEDYRLGLDAQQWAMVPDHPAGDIELLEVELEDASTSAATNGTMIYTGCTPHYY